MDSAHGDRKSEIQRADAQTADAVQLSLFTANTSFSRVYGVLTQSAATPQTSGGIFLRKRMPYPTHKLGL